jgi:DNA-binding transcriptional LysR family regulator
MKLRQLQMLDMVARHQSVTGAAEALGLGQPAVSLQLKLLEQEYDKTFLKRTNRGVKITEEGQKFLDAIRPVLAQVDKLEGRFRSGQPLKNAGTLVIGGSHTHSVTILPEVIGAFQRMHPNVMVELETQYSHDIEENILNARIEVGLISSKSHYSHCVYEDYKELHTVAFVAPDHPLAGRVLSLAELSRQPLVVRKMRASVNEIAELGHPLNLVLECDAPDAVKAAVRNGVGVGILFRSRIGMEIATGEFSEIKVPELERIVARSCIVYDRRRPLSTSAHDFLNLLRELKSTLP